MVNKFNPCKKCGERFVAPMLDFRNICPLCEKTPKVFEINFEDLTSEAQRRLCDLLDDQPAIGPLAILEFEEES